MSMTIQQAKELERLKQTNPSLLDRIVTNLENSQNSIFGNWGKEEIELNRLYNTDPNYKVSPSYGEAKGANLMNLLGGGHIPGVYDWVDNAIGGIQTAALGGGTLGYQLWDEVGEDMANQTGIVNKIKAIPGGITQAGKAAFEQMKGYTQQRFDPSTRNSLGGNYGMTAKEVFDRAILNERTGNVFNNPYDITALGGPRAKGNIFNQGTIDPSEFIKPAIAKTAIAKPAINRPTSAQTNQSLAMDSQLTQSQAGNRQTPTSVSPTTVNIPKPSTTRRARGTRGRSAPVVRQPNLFSNQRIGGRYGL